MCKKRFLLKEGRIDGRGVRAHMQMTEGQENPAERDQSNELCTCHLNVPAQREVNFACKCTGHKWKIIEVRVFTPSLVLQATGRVQKETSANTGGMLLRGHCRRAEATILFIPSAWLLRSAAWMIL